MVMKVKGRTPPYMPPGLYTLTYWDADWEELEHLRLENAGPVEAVEALKTWLRERDLIRARKVSSSAMIDAVAVSLRRAHEED